ncbi:kinase-like protein [Rhodotorula sp. JG-1b]|nr:kinase-like protein [Rhodotorula sp. JG-1b]
MNPPSPDRSPPQTTSRNALFDVDWAPVTPNTRSRSSTVESRFSTASTSSSANRRSWMDVDPPSAEQGFENGQAPPFERRETVTSFHDATPVVGSKSESGFEWLPQTPVSPMRRLPISPHNSMPAFEPLPSAASPLTPPPPLSLARPGPAFPPTPTSPPRPPSRPSPVEFPESATLPATAGHSANPLLDTRRAPSLRLSPSPTYLLGEGRHANVYLASCEPVEPVGSVRAERVPRRRRLCAVKRLFPDRDSQVSGLGEAFILAKLASSAEKAEVGSPNIIRLYGVRDERDGVDPPAPLPSSISTSSRSSLRLSYGSGQTVPSPLGRTSSDLDGARHVAMREVTASAGTAAAARRFGRKSARNSDTVLVDADAGHGKSKLSLLSHALDPPLSSSRRRTVSTPQPAASPPVEPPSAGGLAPPFSLTPRIDLLLEYCPLGHVLQFARAHPECLDKARWFDWAKQLTGAVKWAHEKNVLHADIKPQNVLIASDFSLRLADWGNSLFLPSPTSPPHLFPTDPHGLGTPSYSPPEYVHALPSPFSYSSDIFSLGITLYVLLTATEPYEGIRALERVMRVAEGGWWEFEEGRRLGLLAQEAEGELSRSGSVRSNRSGRSSVRGSLRGPSRRDSSVESVRSYMSASGIGEQGPRDWRAIAKTLLVDPEISPEALEDAVSEALPPPPPPISTQQRNSTARSIRPASLSDRMDEDDVSPRCWSPATSQYYPGTSCPVQYFLSAPAFDDDADEDGLRSHVVPLAVRELIRRMTSPLPSDRPTAAEVWLEACRIGSVEGIWASNQS